MYPQPGASMAPPQKPETFMLSNEAQQSLPQDAQAALHQVDNLKYFLISAPVDWSPEQLIRRFLLPTGDYISCVLWNNLFHISGTDIVRCLSFRFQAFGRPVRNSKKFEEGIFSDLRNLKAGTDASLEEPKSPFLDFLYKNNCIRTQKKQKVFFWYSVPHDRLFLDALERDLKREKMGQDPTTLAINEPALSFRFDSSQSLYDQLTRAQQANTSSFTANVAAPMPPPTLAANYPAASLTSVAPVAPIIRDPMPPPQMPPVMPVVPEEPASLYGQITMPQMAPMPPINVPLVKRDPDFGQLQYDRSGMPLNRVQQQQRHTSMPSYMEYSPAPSFVSSHFDEYGNRGISFEPVTPPQHAVPISSEPAYIANEDTGLYTAIPDVGTTGAFNPLAQLPPSNFVGLPFSANARSFAPGGYTVLDGSPNYKQRRRVSSVSIPANGILPANTSATANAAVGAPIVAPTAQNPAALRSVSSSVAPVSEGDESSHASPPELVPTSHAPSVSRPKESMSSRQQTPMPSLEEDPQDDQLSLIKSQPDDLFDSSEGLGQMRAAPAGVRLEHHPGGPVRRARSATMMELGPYSQKCHSCPIPSCGRLFKRLEHLKRHVRTHTQERPYTCSLCHRAFSRSDNLAQHRRTHEAQPTGNSHVMGNAPVQSDYDHEDKEFGPIDNSTTSPAHDPYFLPGIGNDLPLPSSLSAACPSSTALPFPIVSPHVLTPQMM